MQLKFLTAKCRLWENNIASEGARALADALKYNVALTTLKYVSQIIANIVELLYVM